MWKLPAQLTSEPSKKAKPKEASAAITDKVAKQNRSGSLASREQKGPLASQARLEG